MRFLDYRLAKPARIALICIVCVLPVRYVLNRFSPQTYFTSLVYYGSDFYAKAIPEVQDIKPTVNSKIGYDGQFYSQIAIHPSLKTPGMREALDLPAYRAMRPLLPWLSYLAGFGRPFWILQAYALSNLFFWYLLLFGMLRYLRPTVGRDYLCILAACLSSGPLFSLQRALIDLPAATFCLFGAFLAEQFAVVAIAAAVLTKESYILQLVERPFHGGKTGSVAPVVIKYACILIPALLWHFYVHVTFGFAQFGRTNFGWPFSGYFTAIAVAIRTLSHKDISFFSATSLLAPMSLLVQGLYLFSATRTPFPYRRTGMVFAAISIFLSGDVFVEQLSYCRDLIPVSLAFNIALMQNPPRRFVSWFVTGNIGLTMGLLRLIAG
jgi:hypothetical protein